MVDARVFVMLTFQSENECNLDAFHGVYAGGQKTGNTGCSEEAASSDAAPSSDFEPLFSGGLPPTSSPGFDEELSRTYPGLLLPGGGKRSQIALSEDMETQRTPRKVPDDSKRDEPAPKKVRVAGLFKSPMLARRTDESPEMLSAIKVKMTLEKQRSELREEISTCEKALKIQRQKDADENLLKLKRAWLKAAQEAAERLYEKAKSRVDALGGFNNMMFMSQWEDDAAEGDPSDDFDAEAEKPKVEAQQPQEYTMAYFLRQVGIPLELIQYDEKLESFYDCE